jgi:septin family protein
MPSVARDDLKEYTEDTLYEQYRTEKLLSLKNTA